MLKKLLSTINVSLSRPKEYEIDLTTYYPLDVGVSTEFEGVYTSSQETFPFTCFIENIDICPVNGQLTAMQYKAFINKNMNIIFDQIKYFANNESQVMEYAIISNGEYKTHPEPLCYIDTDVKKKAVNNVFEFNTFEKITFNEEETYCYVIRKEFYSGKTHLRTEKLYLVDGVGLIRYEEKNYPEKIELTFQISEQETGYQVLKNRSFVYSLYNPNEKVIIGNLPNSSRTNFKVFLNEEENDPNESLEVAETLYQFIRSSDKEEAFRSDLSSLLLNKFIQSDEDIDKDLVTESIALDNVFFYNGVMELFYSDGGLFHYETICVVIDKNGNIVNIEMREYN